MREFLIIHGALLLQVDKKTLGQNLYFLIGFWIFVVLAVIALIATLTMKNYLKWRAEKEHYAIERRKKLFAPDGTPYPPAARGLCDNCGKAFEKVYHLKTGRRLCKSCYEKQKLKADS